MIILDNSPVILPVLYQKKREDAITWKNDVEKFLFLPREAPSAFHRVPFGAVRACSRPRRADSASLSFFWGTTR